LALSIQNVVVSAAMFTDNSELQISQLKNGREIIQYFRSQAEATPRYCNPCNEIIT